MAEPAIDADALWAHMEAIARSPREAGSDGEARAFDYIAAQLERIGAGVTRDVVPALISLPRGAELSVGGRVLAAITHAMAASTRTGGVEGRLVAGATVPQDAWRGEIVVLEGLALPAAVRRAERAGAAAALFANADRIAHEMIVSTVWGSPGPQELSLLPGIPVASVGSEDAATLRMAAARSQSARLVTEVETRWREIPELVAEVRAPRAADEQFVLLSGHVDSWHRGAMDNAGANAVMLEVTAATCARRDGLRRHLRVAFWSGHSQGRYAGSAAYVDRHWEQLERDCVVHVNIDSVGGRGATLLSEAPATADVEHVGAKAVRALTGQPLSGRRPGRAGDQSLANLGVSSLFLTLSEQATASDDALRDGIAALTTGAPSASGGLGWWWHTPQDTPDKLDRSLLQRDAEIYRRAIESFTSEPVLPLDIAASANELVHTLDTLADFAKDRFDLARVVAEARDVARSAHRAMRVADRLGRAPDGPRVTALNRHLLAASRPLTRLSHVAGDRFEHDDAEPRPPVPLLAPIDALAATEPGSDDEQALLVLLTRLRNRVTNELATSAHALGALLSDTCDRS